MGPWRKGWETSSGEGIETALVTHSWVAGSVLTIHANLFIPTTIPRGKNLHCPPFRAGEN